MTSSQPPEIPPIPPIPPVQYAQVVQAPPKVSSWPKVVGIIGIIFGAVGLLGGAQLLFMPKMMETQRGMMSEMRRMSESHQPDRRNPGPKPDEVFKMVENMFDLPPWFATWTIIGGSLAMAISAVYIFGAIRLIQLKAGAPSLFCWAAGLAVALAIVRVVVGVSIGSLMSISLILGAVCGGIADGVLFCITATGDKKMFGR